MQRTFLKQGISVKDEAGSSSGVRDHDGVVVFAIQAADVRVADWGSSCVLWTPNAVPASAERLEHCRLALRDGSAEGLLVDRGRIALSQDLFALRVVRAGYCYWAKWGSVARAKAEPQYALMAAYA